MSLARLQPKDKDYYVVGKYYAITFNPKKQYNMSRVGTTTVRDRVTQFNDYVGEIFMSLKCGYHFKTEISHPYGDIPIASRYPRLHCHGVVTFNNQKAITHFLLSGLPAIIQQGKVKIDRADSIDKWVEYMYKQDLLPIKHSRHRSIPDPIEEILNKLVDPIE